MIRCDFRLKFTRAAVTVGHPSIEKTTIIIKLLKNNHCCELYSLRKHYLTEVRNHFITLYHLSHERRGTPKEHTVDESLSKINLFIIIGVRCGRAEKRKGAVNIFSDGNCSPAAGTRRCGDAVLNSDF